MIRQSTTATALAQWLASLTRGIPGSELDGPADVVEHVWHASLQDDGGGKWIGEGKQMTSGPACFAILLAKKEYAEHLGHVLELFTVCLFDWELGETGLMRLGSLRRRLVELKVSSSSGPSLTLELIPDSVRSFLFPLLYLLTLRFPSASLHRSGGL